MTMSRTAAWRRNTAETEGTPAVTVKGSWRRSELSNETNMFFFWAPPNAKPQQFLITCTCQVFKRQYSRYRGYPFIVWWRLLPQTTVQQVFPLLSYSIAPFELIKLLKKYIACIGSTGMCTCYLLNMLWSFRHSSPFLSNLFSSSDLNPPLCSEEMENHKIKSPHSQNVLRLAN